MAVFCAWLFVRDVCTTLVLPTYALGEQPLFFGVIKRLEFLTVLAIPMAAAQFLHYLGAIRMPPKVSRSAVGVAVILASALLVVPNNHLYDVLMPYQVYCLSLLSFAFVLLTDISVK